MKMYLGEIEEGSRGREEGGRKRGWGRIEEGRGKDEKVQKERTIGNEDEKVRR